MTTFEKSFREYAEKHPDATVEEATKHAKLDAEFEETIRQLDHNSLVFIHDLLQELVESKGQ